MTHSDEPELWWTLSIRDDQEPGWSSVLAERDAGREGTHQIHIVSKSDSILSFQPMTIVGQPLSEAPQPPRRREPDRWALEVFQYAGDNLTLVWCQRSDGALAMLISAASNDVRLPSSGLVLKQAEHEFYRVIRHAPGDLRRPGLVKDLEDGRRERLSAKWAADDARRDADDARERRQRDADDEQWRRQRDADFELWRQQRDTR